MVGLAIGGAYLAGGMAKDAVVHAQIQRLAGRASTGFSEAALNASAKEDPGALAIARRLDPEASASLDLHQQKMAALVDRLNAGKAAPSAGKIHLASNPAPVIRASFTSPGVAQPFKLRGALDESRDLECLAQAVYYEARGEGESGQAAVAQVVLNRVRHPAFPKSICAVVFQGARTPSCQFSFACDGALHHPVDSLAWRRAERIAQRALDGAVAADVGNATHFHVAGLNTGWSASLQRVAQIGSHIFYKFAGRGGAAHMFHGDVQPSDKPLEVKPVFASFVPALPTAAQAQQALSAVVQSAAKAVGAGDTKAAVQVARPAEAPAAAPPAPSPVQAPADEAAKTQPAA